ncbi:MAG: acyl-CoA dehydrogenase family protein [Pseudomonadota bacterium]
MRHGEASGDNAETVRLLKESAAAFATKESPLTRARALRQTEPDFDLAFWRRLAEQGWTGLLVPEKHGGFGLGFAEMAAVVEQFAARVAPEPLVPTAVFAARLMQHCGEHELAASLLSRLASGGLIAAVAWQESPLHIDPCVLKARAVRDGGDVLLSGEKRHIRPGMACEGFIVSALAERDEIALYWMPRAAAGLVVDSEMQADGSRTARLRINGVRLDASQCLARGATAADALLRAFDETLVMASVELLALSRTMLAMTIEYLRTRVQFGKPIGSFQALRHRAVDLFIQQELTSTVVAQAVDMLDSESGAGERRALAGRAKARASEAALLIARESVQLHGAIGYTDEYDLGLYLNRALVLSAWLGNGLAHRRRFAADHPLRSLVAA